MISQQVQAVLDRAKQNQSLTQSVDLGMQALSQQVATLQATIAALPVGNALSDDDKAALTEAASDLDTSIATLQKDIPANTPAAPGSQIDPNAGQAASSSNPGPAQASTDPAADASQHQADSDAASQAKPLAGTGASS